MINIEHIHAFADMMKEKGYDGSFINAESSVTGPLTRLLTLELMKNYGLHEENKPSDFMLLTITDRDRDVQGDISACSFDIRYDKEKGFRVTSVIVGRYDGEGQEKNRLVFVVESPDNIPAMAVSVVLSKSHVHIVKIPRQRGFNLN